MVDSSGHGDLLPLSGQL